MNETRIKGFAAFTLWIGFQNESEVLLLANYLGPGEQQRRNDWNEVEYENINWKIYSNFSGKVGGTYFLVFSKYLPLHSEFSLIEHRPVKS